MDTDRFEKTIIIITTVLVAGLAIAQMDIKKEFNEKQVRNELRMKEWLAGQEMRPDYLPVPWSRQTGQTADYRRGR